MKLAVNSPRQCRTLAALVRFGSVPRSQMDELIGAQNSPQIISELRSLGWGINTARTRVIDRDGKCTFPGIYSLAPGYLEAAEQVSSRGCKGAGKAGSAGAVAAAPDEGGNQMSFNLGQEHSQLTKYSPLRPGGGREC